MERNLTSDILHTLQTTKQKIIIYGLPCVGKTYLLQELAKKYRGSYISCDLITDRDFYRALQEHIEQCKECLNNGKNAKGLDSFLCEFLHLSPQDLSQTLIIFDGLECLKEDIVPLLQTSLPDKFLAATARADYLTQLPMPLMDPPLIRLVPLCPLSFQEFLEATGHHWYRTIIQEHVHRSEALPELICNELQELFHDYLLVGGFPGAVLGYCNNRTDLSAIRSIHNMIFSCIWYRIANDLPEYLSMQRIEQIIQYIRRYSDAYAQPFRPAYIRKGTALNDYIDEIHFLVQLGLLLPVYMQNGDLYRFEPTDCGMLRYLCNDYDMFYVLDEESGGLPVAMYQNYLYITLHTNEYSITPWRYSRNFYAPYFSKSEQLVILTEEPPIRSRTISTLREVEEHVTIWQLNHGETITKNADHNIQYFAFEETLVSKKRLENQHFYH